MHAHGHHPNSRQIGQAHPLAKLTARQVRTMRREFAMGFASIKWLAQQSGVSISTASKAIHRQTWRHVR